MFSALETLYSTVNIEDCCQHHSLREPKFTLAIQRMTEEMISRGAADVFQWWLFTTTDVIGELTFGSSFRTLDIGQVVPQDIQTPICSRYMLTKCIEKPVFHRP
jgi:hypothetical protein